ncbi:MAG: tRNA 5-hydroxyuridine modification protein YegQ [Candidatus Thiodiazotropha sp. (ex Lucinoma aequizonata)]|nr:tRNA 5-hydroxyuridine modification protein YegQ [Candidatus Thiodiazotropha sp. (ex Lucinoma aequizonata)]MCU7889442.1 tRNA 5-hydroxyuridine modification protein YegQ [Candidatus Thiodiazotropha sp. (ex Lucinoma aequizonata)]MCU7895061.1 tRNA 5-hydroxyuridine modification protein YegQ [Candidatus Thiodiazotropha sp. (ex Lucinoma aequizonata)]MCU7897459.1 tRNA 5-hydroxyuridine modification protein YegQ [Candidatus Thiodiazotropha sp. (ex Lucinoma aequizonata)]MCU7900925.1 tRNA 5-hydroxyuridin
MKRSELLSPAGTLKNARYAFAYGADAVYAGLPRYSLRVRNNGFLQDNLAIGIADAHALQRQFYLACNVMPHNAKLKTFIKDLEPVIDMGPDALIMSDPGLILMVREAWPEMPLHLSVQANTVNAEAVRFWQQQGVSRVILSRELSLEEVQEIRESCPDMELEVFIHGALCIAYSGRCLLSGYFNHRDANQGTCTNSCRWDYKVFKSVDAPSLSDGPAGVTRHSEADDIYYIEENGLPGEQMPVFEDEHGTYIMNSRDLRAVEHVARLVEIGVDCLKIEGRTKSHYYTARTAQVYRQAIDDAVAGRPFQVELMADLESLANRGYTDGFYQRHESQQLQNYRYGSSQTERQQFVGEVTGIDDASGLIDLDVKNKIRVGDRLELMTPTGNYSFILERMEDRYGNAMQEALGGGYQVRVQLPTPEVKNALLCRYLKQV